MATSSSRPRGRRRSATPCWIHRSRWRPGCSTTTPTATTRSPAPSSTASPSGSLTRDHILDNITPYWLTGTGASAARSYWESGQATARAAGQAPPPVSVPVGFTTFPGEIVADAAKLGRAGLPHPHLLQQGRQGRPLRRLGRARAVLRRDPRGVQTAPGAGSHELMSVVHLPWEAPEVFAEAIVGGGT